MHGVDIQRGNKFPFDMYISLTSATRINFTNMKLESIYISVLVAYNAFNYNYTPVPSFNGSHGLHGVR